MSDFELVGFIGEARGDEDTVVLAPPVVRTAAGWFVANGTNWTDADLKPVEDSERELVRTLMPGDRAHTARIETGQSVWFAGSTFAPALIRMAEANRHRRPISTWTTADRGARWRLGFAAEFEEYVTVLANSLEPLLQQALFDKLEMSYGDARAIFDLYEALPIKPSRSRLLNIGLYYDSQVDTYERSFVAADAVQLGLFDSEREFERAVTSLAEDLRRRRLSEGQFVPGFDRTMPYPDRTSAQEIFETFITRFTERRNGDFGDRRNGDPFVDAAVQRRLGDE